MIRNREKKSFYEALYFESIKYFKNSVIQLKFFFIFYNINSFSKPYFYLLYEQKDFY